MASCQVLSVSWRFTFWPATLGATTMSTRPEAESPLKAERISMLEKLKFWRCAGPFCSIGEAGAVMSSAWASESKPATDRLAARRRLRCMEAIIVSFLPYWIPI